MGDVTNISRFQRGVTGSLDEHLFGDVAEEIRQFLRTTWLGRDSHSDPEHLDTGRALIEDYALRAAALRDNQEGAEYGQDLTLAEVASVLRYLRHVCVKDDGDCYGHDGGASACGYNHITGWLQRQVERYAERLGEIDSD